MYGFIEANCLSVQLLPAKAQERPSWSKGAVWLQGQVRGWSEGSRVIPKPPLTQNKLRHGWGVGHICLSWLLVSDGLCTSDCSGGKEVRPSGTQAVSAAIRDQVASGVWQTWALESSSDTPELCDLEHTHLKNDNLLASKGGCQD